MTTPPLALTIHDGHSPMTELRQKLVSGWLTANGIPPSKVAAGFAISVLLAPYRPAAADEDTGLIQVIAFHQFYTDPDGNPEQNLLTRQAVAFQRTVPLTVPFPTDFPTSDQPTQADAQDTPAEDLPEEAEPAPEPEPESASDEAVPA